ncbi:TIGR03013 family XrtA/PEP-CTERM system glycosyltransferase [Nitrospira defluvii]|uniref:Bac_transf domain-containing protein n=1 Tax=Nitrospira defluvii TaxID=330214 RepID=A0ABM8RDP9_9BACT|nr:TIGR03013 family XrtA/PEP-CTERM system glycosyltransferase [Nitrospira defluvii]CAE6746982.1 Bac_transf domain-containing protein [Nitrospira defluvii]
MNSSSKSDQETGLESLSSRQPLVSVSVSFPKFTRRVLILGVGPLARDLCQTLLAKRAGFTEVVGFLDKDASRVGERLVNPTIIGTYDQLFEIAERYQVHTVAVCLEDRRAVLPVQTLLDMKAMGRDVVDGHYLYEEESGRLSIDHLKPSALIFSTGFRRRLLTMLFKRALDVVVAIVGMIALLPVVLVLSVLIKLDSSGPVFYRQMRVGLRGRPYMIWKFRSMRQDAEQSGARWASNEDPRVSRVGRWIRKWRLDELPQLINVLKGEMSLVGPRPERPVFVQELRNTIPYYDLRHTVRPGITGWAQTRFRYGASKEDSHVKLQYDLFYVKNLSLALDFRIVVHTVKVMFMGEGAR